MPRDDSAMQWSFAVFHTYPGSETNECFTTFSESEVVKEQCWTVLEEVPLSRLCVKGGPQCQTLKTSSQDNSILRFFIKRRKKKEED